MAHIYELGYGSYEESEFAQLQHRRKFSQSRFEKMVLELSIYSSMIRSSTDKRVS